jgi:hypothetical protein
MSRTKTRRRSSRLLTALVALLLPLTLIATWSLTTVTNTDRYVATLHPLAHDPAIIGYVADEASKAIVDQLNVEQQIHNLIPISLLTSTLTASLQKTIDDVIRKSLNTSAFQTLWDRENRFTHSTAVAVLSGDANPEINKVRKVA